MKHLRCSAAELIKKLTAPIPNELIEQRSYGGKIGATAKIPQAFRARKTIGKHTVIIYDPKTRS